jgi:hypothetical protein
MQNRPKSSRRGASFSARIFPVLFGDGSIKIRKRPFRIQPCPEVSKPRLTLYHPCWWTSHCRWPDSPYGPMCGRQPCDIDLCQFQYLRVFRGSPDPSRDDPGKRHAEGSGAPAVGKHPGRGGNVTFQGSWKASFRLASSKHVKRLDRHSCKDSLVRDRSRQQLMPTTIL